MSDFTLDGMREAVEREFAPFQFSVGDELVTMGNPLRMSKKDRKALVEHFEVLSSLTEKDDEGSEEPTEDAEDKLIAAQKAIVKIACGKHGALVVKEIGDDLTLYMYLINEWAKVVNPGEASSSQD